MTVLNNTLLLAGAATPAAGYQISRSLRFNSSDSAYLSRTPSVAGNRKTWTWAGWVKRTTPSSGSYNFFWGIFDPTGNNGMTADWSGDSLSLKYAVGGSYQITSSTSAVFRDYSAWYHIVIAFDTTQAVQNDRLKIYANGVLQPLTGVTWALNADYDINSVTPHSIGRAGQYNGFYLNAYLADIHFIDGQALTTTSFGQFDTNGVWQPKAYTGTYGTNGFHLDFADNSAATATTLGKDTSGNGNNWTPNNLSVTGTGTNYNALVTATGTGGLAGPYPLSLAFDNDLATFCACSSSGTSEGAVSLSFDFTRRPVSVVSTVRVYFAPGLGVNFQKARVNGGSYVSSGSIDYAQLSFSGTLTSIDVTLGPGVSGPKGTGATIAAIDVDGVRLISINTSDCDSLVDSPTNGTASSGGDAGGTVVGNYATWNPLDQYASNTYSNGNLDVVVAAGSPIVPVVNSTLGVSSGKWYWEVSATAGTGAALMIGICSLSVSASDRTFNGANAWMYYSFNGTKYNSGSGVSYGATYTFNDVIGVALDMDAGTVTFYKNGSSQGVAYSAGLSGKVIAPSVSNGTGSGTQTYTANFGQRPFAYAAPAGFKSLNTANLPTPTILNGATVFDTKLYTGNGSTQTISGLGFSPDLVWIKNRAAAVSHYLQDVVRGTYAYMNSNSSGSENTSSGADWFSTFDSTGFTVKYGSTGFGNSAGWNENGTAYAAWCWDAGTANVTNTQGSITSTVRANPSAGFSVVTYTGNGVSGATAGHGLGILPGMIVLKSRTSGVYNWRVAHSGVAVGDMLFLNTTDAKYTTTANNAGYISAYTSSTFTLTQAGANALDAVNKTGDTYVAYCFAPVSGYSSFGSYTGNGSADGPFVYTGFRPRWVLLKNTSAGNWIIVDALRPGYNVTNATLFPNLTNAESPDSDRQIDALSNGFKVRANTGSTDINGNAQTIIYAAFAENPFSIARAR